MQHGATSHNIYMHSRRVATSTDAALWHCAVSMPWVGWGQGPYFMGSELSLVDVTFTPMLERIAASMAYYKGYYIRGKGTWPNVER